MKMKFMDVTEYTRLSCHYIEDRNQENSENGTSLMHQNVGLVRSEKAMG